MKKRLDPRVFKVPIDKIRAGYYSDKYFTRYVTVLKRANKATRVLYQYFPRKDAVVVGIDEALAILRFGTGYYRDDNRAEELFNEILSVEKAIQFAAWEMDKDSLVRLSEKKWALKLELNTLWVDKWEEIEVRALYDGDEAKDMEPVMTIEGDPRYFGYLETVLLGVLARASSTATAVKKVVESSRGKPILFFSARFDHFWTQATDGYAALKAGAFGVSTDANADYWGVESLGTIPHALIAAYNGSTEEAAIAFDEHIKPSVNRIVLVDWDNDVINTTYRVIGKFYEKVTGEKFILGKSDPSIVIGSGKGKVWGVRFDTSGSLRDRSVVPKDASSLGVCPELVWTARKEFDKYGMKDLRIVVSGGFDAEKIELFEKLEVPVDVYGVGSKLLKEKVDFTADVVEVNGKACAKYGREKGDLSRLSIVEKNYWENE
ncbi:nicotinate phosphoribosyltransferase [Kosmotoga pacifica]|uniref:nicotinate phosphoribosyltransferase n=1 Tax=Kosmotoga pacifica TaxID=1330330 RepID=A0A0G2ZFE3_9BACT|nr:nicotinate phosphoribosyltransferase [Kosmotoga pacifica]AKI97488.1 nicotinate phosphoribosyltransferase [Kosmotoga pacifica]